MPSHVVGVASNRLLLFVVSPNAIVIAAVMIRVTICPALILKVAVPPNREISPASVVHPNAAVIGAPAVAFHASCFAVLR
jgi:hypothetical protein